MKKSQIIQQPSGIAAVSAMVCGVLIHMFGLVTILHNYDDIVTQPLGYGTGVTSGRWFLTFLGDLMQALSFGYNLSWVNGLLFIALIAVSAGFLVSAVGLKSKKAAALWGALLVCFPTVTGTLLFNYTAPYYGVSLFLAVFAVWVLPKIRLGFVVSILCIACSLGIYQAYVPVTITLFVMILLKKLLDEDGKIPDLLKQGIFDCLVLGAGLALYYVIVKITMASYGGALNSYQGISEMGQMSVRELLRMVIQSLKGFYRIPLFDNFDLAQVPLLRLGYGLAYIATFALIWAVLLVKKKSFLHILAVGALWLVFPVAVNFITVMTPNGFVYTIMVYPFVLVFCLPSLLAEWLPEGMLRRIGSGLVTGVLVLVITLYSYWANVNYTALYYANRQTENYMNALYTQVRMTPGFDGEMKWALLGQIEDPMFYGYWDRVPIYGGNTGREGLVNAYSRIGWLMNYLGCVPELASDEELARLQTLPEVQAMPCWPDYGSIAVVEDTMVIKFQN